MKGDPESAKGKLIPVDWNKVPWWVVIVIIALLLIINAVRLNPTYLDTLAFLSGYTLWLSRGVITGVILTLVITFVAYAITLVIGLIMGLARLSKNPVMNTRK